MYDVLYLYDKSYAFYFSDDVSKSMYIWTKDWGRLTVYERIRNKAVVSSIAAYCGICGDLFLSLQAWLTD